MGEIVRTPVKSIFVGLDLSICATGFAIKTDDKVKWETIKSEPGKFKNELDRYDYILSEIKSKIPSFVNMICIENFFIPPPKLFGSKATIDLISLGIIVRNYLYKEGYSFGIVPPKQLKKFCTGRGDTSKSLILREIYKKYGFECDDDNQGDAVVLAFLAQCMFGILKKNENNSFKKYEIDVVKKIVNEGRFYNIQPTMP